MVNQTNASFRLDGFDPTPEVLELQRCYIEGEITIQGMLDWGSAPQLSYSGYLNRFTAKAGDVLPILARGVPDHDDITIIGDDYLMPAGWKGNIVMHQDKIAACPADQVLTIDVWDRD